MKKTMLFWALAVSASAQTYNVKIIQWLPIASEHEESKPATVTTNAQAAAGCKSGSTSTACKGNNQTTTTIQAAKTVRYETQGWQMRLLLPDGRTVLASCSSKFNWGSEAQYRDCRTPPSAEAIAEFKGKNAKLKWPVSLDGKKFESESYEIIKIDAAGTELPPCVETCLTSPPSR